MAIPFVHLADVHLGRLQVSGLSGEQVAQRRLDALLSLRRSLEYVQEAQIPLLFIAGDLFEHEIVSKAIVTEVRDCLARLVQTRVFVAAGNHDYAASDSFYRTLTWPDNVHLFLDDWESVVIEDLHLTVHGRGWREPECSRPLLREYTLGENVEGLHVVLLHADHVAGTKATSAYVPVCRADLEALNADYVALGHWHAPQAVWETAGKVRAAYSGALEPTNFSEEGPHGYLIGKLGRGGAQVELRPVAARQYRNVWVEVTGLDTMEKVTELARQALSDIPQEHLVRLILGGERQPDLELDRIRLQGIGQEFFAFFVEDETTIAYDLETLSEGYSAKAAFVRRLRSRLEGATAEEQVLLRQALHMGLDALAGKEVHLP